MSVENTKARLLDTTKKLLVDKGEQATTMSLISKMSQVSVGSIYNLFAGKEELITAVYIDCRDKLMEGCFDIQHLPGDTPRQIFWQLNRAYLESALAHPYEFKVVTQYHLSPVIDHSVFRPSDFSTEVADQTLLYYSGKGVLKDMSPTTLDLITFGMINQMVKAHFSGFVELTEDLKEKLLDACWDAISTHRTVEDEKECP